MLTKDHEEVRFHESPSRWLRGLSLESIKCLIVCRGPVRKEAIDVFDKVGIAEYGMLLSEKDSIVYPKCLAPELRGFRYPQNVHRVPDYIGLTAEERSQRIDQIIDIAKRKSYSHVFAGYGFMAEDAEFIAALENADLTFVGPSSQVARRAGAKDEAKKLARSLGASVTPGVDTISARALLREVTDREGLISCATRNEIPFTYNDSLALEDNAEDLLQAGYARKRELVSITALQREAQICCDEIWATHPGRRIRFKHIGGGGGKGQRVVESASQLGDAVMEVLAESKATTPGANRNFLIELNIETTRHNEIQLIGNGQWCLSLGGRDCSVQMHEQKLVELSLTQELLEREIERAAEQCPQRAAVLKTDAEVLAALESDGEKFGEAVGLNSVSTFEAIVEDDRHYFMEMNTRIQVEHRVTEMVYRLKFTNPEGRDVFYIDSLIEAMLLLSEHGPALSRPERELRHPSAAEVRINATNKSLQPHAGGLIYEWSPPRPNELRDDQGIGTPNPATGQFVYYNLAGAYDSNIALVVTHGDSREDNLRKLADILRRTEIRGYELQTNLAVHYGLVSWMLGREPLCKPPTNFMIAYLAAVGALERVVREIDMDYAWKRALAATDQGEARQTLALKQTLITRPLLKLFDDAHLLAGFVGLHDSGDSWRWDGEEVFLTKNPVDLLASLYQYLNLDARPEKPPCNQIWDHDESMLRTARTFYTDLERVLGPMSWEQVDQRLRDDTVPPELDQATWRACQASHRGFTVGMDLLLIVPRAAKLAGFLELTIDSELRPVIPERFTDPKQRTELIKALSPAPVATSDEIVSPTGGHFYAREAPDLPPLIEEGEHFEKGQPLFVVEVMKMFNKVKAPFSGTVKRELMRDRDGQVIVKGQPIFRIVPDEEVHPESEEERASRRREITTQVLGLAR
jgi:acetyl/propionyl-CoA carboxylase alpha subunit